MRSKPEKERIKTLAELGALSYKNARKAIDPVSERYALDPRIWSRLVVIATEILRKHPYDDPDKLLDRLRKHKQIKEWLQSDTINEGDLRDALDAAAQNVPWHREI
jgi:hypothetical protein